MSSNIVVIGVQNGEASLVFSNIEADFTIVNMDLDEFYVYNDIFLCVVTSLNEDGTVDLKCVDVTDSTSDSYVGRLFKNIPANLIYYYGDSSDTDNEFDEMLDDSEWGLDDE